MTDASTEQLITRAMDAQKFMPNERLEKLISSTCERYSSAEVSSWGDNQLGIYTAEPSDPSPE